MTKKFSSTKLGVRIIGWVILSVISAVITFFIVVNSAHLIIKNNLETDVYLSQQTALVKNNLQKYVDKNNVYSTDIELLNNFAKSQKEYSFNLIFEDRVMYSSYYYVSNIFTMEVSEPVFEKNNLPEIQLKDKTVKLQVIGFFGGHFYVFALGVSFVCAFLVFLIVMLNLIKTHVSYIALLEKEVRELENGNLNYAITVKGSDELAGLANNIDEMRKSFIEKLENENKAIQANSELITAMSHDLRTPLTTQIGYLDIISLKKYKDEEQLFEYVQKTREKAYQIKNLSDKLFKYFLAFEESNSEKVETEVYCANELFGQIIDENIFFIEEQGFDVEYSMLEKEMYLKTNADLLFRIFDNIFSNILKYASKSLPVKIMVLTQKDVIVISCVNSIPKIAPKVQSTEIGLKNSQKIAQDLGGILQYHKTDTTFFVQLELPFM